MKRLVIIGALLGGLWFGGRYWWKRETSPVPPLSKGKGGMTYTVRSGDTLSAIAERYGTTWRRLAALNKLENPDLIHPGQVLVIRA